LFALPIIIICLLIKRGSMNTRNYFHFIIVSIVNRNRITYRTKFSCNGRSSHNVFNIAGHVSSPCGRCSEPSLKGGARGNVSGSKGSTTAIFLRSPPGKERSYADALAPEVFNRITEHGSISRVNHEEPGKGVSPNANGRNTRSPQPAGIGRARD